MGIAASLTNIINLFVTELQTPVAVVLGLVIIVNGYRLLTGNSQTVEKAKSALIIALVGLFLVLAGPKIADIVKTEVEQNANNIGQVQNNGGGLQSAGGN